MDSVHDVSGQDEIVWRCSYCWIEGTDSTQVTGRISHGACALHVELVMLTGRRGAIWNPERWASNPPRVPLPVVRIPRVFTAEEEAGLLRALDRA